MSCTYKQMDNLPHTHIFLLLFQSRKADPSKASVPSSLVVSFISFYELPLPFSPSLSLSVLSIINADILPISQPVPGAIPHCSSFIVGDWSKNNDIYQIYLLSSAVLQCSCASVLPQYTPPTTCDSQCGCSTRKDTEHFLQQQLERNVGTLIRTEALNLISPFLFVFQRIYNLGVLQLLWRTERFTEESSSLMAKS